MILENPLLCFVNYQKPRVESSEYWLLFVSNVCNKGLGILNCGQAFHMHSLELEWGGKDMDSVASLKDQLCSFGCKLLLKFNSCLFFVIIILDTSNVISSI